MSADAEWKQGWEDGYQFALKNFNPVTGYSVNFPENFVHRGDLWSCGFAEGEICGHGEVWDKHFKKSGKTLLSIHWDTPNKKYIATYK